MRLSENFTLAELTRSDTAVRLGINNRPSQAVIENLASLCTHILEPVRKQFGRIVRVTSGYRSPELNLAVGGNPKGSHPDGEAADFEVDDTSNLAVARWIAASQLPFDQVILEFHIEGDPSSGWVHCSHRRSRPNRREVITALRKANGGTEYRSGLP